ncbi:MAG: response regulator transcription factor [Dehalococcoidia bacterium]|nr:MAG: response regulator transcription factor [Dehalococcoidia bacterium]UCG83223.1 MAG: response regulator transcription factor [Dehalococcoidia bacterium]
MVRINILIADDHPSVRAGTRHILEEEEDLNVIAEAADGQAALALTLDLKPDVAIIDIAMPEVDGIEVARRIRALSPSTAVLIYTVIDDAEFIASALEVGADGYLLKSVRRSELIQAVRQVYNRRERPLGSDLWKVIDSFGR